MDLHRKCAQALRQYDQQEMGVAVFVANIQAGTQAGIDNKEFDRATVFGKCELCFV